MIGENILELPTVWQTGFRVMNIDPKAYAEIAALIHSDESPVGIDAKKTHILILHKLTEIEKRLEALENRALSDDDESR